MKLHFSRVVSAAGISILPDRSRMNNLRLQLSFKNCCYLINYIQHNQYFTVHILKLPELPGRRDIVSLWDLSG